MIDNSRCPHLELILNNLSAKKATKHLVQVSLGNVWVMNNRKVDSMIWHKKIRSFCLNTKRQLWMVSRKSFECLEHLETILCLPRSTATNQSNETDVLALFSPASPSPPVAPGPSVQSSPLWPEPTGPQNCSCNRWETGIPSHLYLCDQCWSCHLWAELYQSRLQSMARFSECSQESPTRGRKAPLSASASCYSVLGFLRSISPSLALTSPCHARHSHGKRGRGRASTPFCHQHLCPLINVTHKWLLEWRSG